MHSVHAACFASHTCGQDHITRGDVGTRCVMCAETMDGVSTCLSFTAEFVCVCVCVCVCNMCFCCARMSECVCVCVCVFFDSQQ